MSTKLDERGRPTLAAMLADSLRSDIVGGVLAPGKKLKLGDLSERYQSGLIPLREALSRLATTGLVVAESQRGFRVAPVSVDEILDVTRVRGLIEGLALRESITYGDELWEGEVNQAHAALARLDHRVRERPATASRQWEAAHQKFHHSLVSGCQSPWLLRFRDMLAEQMTRYRHVSLRVWKRTPSRNVPREHQQILKAALARDADEACRLLEAHFARTTDIVLAAAELNGEPAKPSP